MKRQLLFFLFVFISVSELSAGIISRSLSETDTLPCENIITPPYQEDFENPWSVNSQSFNNLFSPRCWIVISRKQNYEQGIWKQASQGYNSEHSAAMEVSYTFFNDTAQRNSDWLISPIISLTGSEVLTFRAKRNQATAFAGLRIFAYDASLTDLDSGEDTANFVLVSPVNTMGLSFTEFEVDLRHLVGEYRLAFVRNTTMGGCVYVDDVKVMPAASCNRVTNLRVTQQYAQSIDLAWDYNPEHTFYNIHYKAFGEENWEIVITDTNFHTVDELIPMTNYEFNITAVCQDSTITDFILGESLQTNTGCPIAQVPFLESFESYVETNTPFACWNEANGLLSDVSSDNSAPIYQNSPWEGKTTEQLFENSAHAGVNLTSILTPAAYWLVSPTIDLGTDGREYDLRFDLAFVGEGVWGEIYEPFSCSGQCFKVLISSDNGATWESHESLTWDSVSPTQTTNRLDLVSLIGDHISVNISELGYNGEVKIAFYAEHLFNLFSQNSIRIDRIRVEPHSDCPELYHLEAEPIGASAVILSWDQETEYDWEIGYSEGSFLESAPTVVEVSSDTSIPYVLEGLDAGGTYTFAIRYACQGSWSPTLTVSLPNSVAELPYYCDFEDLQENSQWEFVDMGHLNKWFIASDTLSPENNKLFISSDNGLTARYETNGNCKVLAGRNIVFNSGSRAYKLEFDFRGGGEGSQNFVSDYLKVGLLDLDSCISGYYTSGEWLNPLFEQQGFTYSGNPYFNLQNDFAHVEIMIDSSVVNNSIKRLVFAWVQNSEYGDSLAIEVDNVRITPLNCSYPTFFAPIDQGIGEHSVTFDIVVENGDFLEVQYRRENETAWNSVTVPYQEYIVVDELESGTVYQFRIRAICEQDSSVFTSALRVCTLCGDIVVGADNPFTEDFESIYWVNVPTITSQGLTAPLCWYNIKASNSYSQWVQTDETAYVYSRNSSVVVQNSVNVPYNAVSSWLISPVFDLQGNETLSFKVKRSANQPVLRLMYYDVETNGDMTSPNDTLYFLPLDTVISPLGEWTAADYSLSGYEGKGRFAFCVSDFGGQIAIDEFSIAEKQCPRVQQAGVNIGNISETSVSITIENEASSWIIYYRAQADSLYTSISTDTSENVIANLLPNTDYELYVVALCGDTEAEAMLPTHFRTTCPGITAFPWTEDFEGDWVMTTGSNVSSPQCWINLDGDFYSLGFAWQSEDNWAPNYNCAASTGNLSNYSSDTIYNNDYLLTPPISVEGGVRLSFHAGIGNYMQSGSLKIKYYDIAANGHDVLSLADTALFEDLVTIENLNYSLTYYEFDLPPLPSLYRLVFAREDISNSSIMIDNVRLDSLPECSSPIYNSITVSEIEANKATLSFDDFNEEHEYWNVCYRVSGSEADFSILLTDTTSVQLTGLISATDYEAFATALCNDQESATTDTISFSTLQIPATIPYYCNFEEQGNNGWRLNNNNCTNVWYIGSPQGYFNCLYISGDGGFTAGYVGEQSVVVAERLVLTSQADSITISFDLTVGGERNNYYELDFLKVFFAPSTEEFDLSFNNLYPDFARYQYSDYVIMSNSPYSNSYTLASVPTTQNMSVTIPNTASTLYRLVFVWANNNGTNLNPGAVIDNITITNAPNTSTEEVIPPSVTTLAPTEITSHSAQLNGQIVAGSQTILSNGFLVRQNGVSDWQTFEVMGENMSFALTNLAPAATYACKAFATTQTQTFCGEEMEFQTLSGLEERGDGSVRFAIRPNPTSDKTIVSIEGLRETARITLSDAHGRVLIADLLNVGEDTYEINTENYESGVYYVRIFCGNNVLVQKLIIL